VRRVHRIMGGLAVALTVVACQAAVAANEPKVEKMDAPLLPNDQSWVPVRLDRHANHRMTVELPGKYIKVDGVPFELIDSTAGNNLSLAKAGWPNWKSDPSSYYSPYDTHPDTVQKTSFSAQEMERYMVSAPVDDYVYAHFLGYAEDDEAYAQVMSLRIGAFGGRGRVTRQDFSVTVPRASEGESHSRVAGKLFMVRLPLNMAAAQDYEDRRALEIDITKELRLAVRRPDPCRYQVRPLGLPSGVHIFAMTLQRSPVNLRVEGAEPGNVFNEPQRPSFRITLRMPAGGGRRDIYTVTAESTDSFGGNTTVSSQPISLQYEKSVTTDLFIPASKRGYHEVAFRLTDIRGNVLLEKRTTFAILPPNTRRFREQSPFGTWDFCGAHYTPNDPDLLGPLYVKAGLRYGTVSRDDAVRQKYGVIPYGDVKGVAERLRREAEALRQSPQGNPPNRIMIFHESAISRAHITRVPDALTGRTYQFDEKEEQTFRRFWNSAGETAKVIHELYPLSEIYFGNGNPMLLEEFLRRKFPAELLGSRGNEAGNFMRSPETQPPDWIANGAGLWVDRMMLDHYGYTNTPLRQCYEMCYPGTNPGNLDLRTQASYYVRHMMHSLSWRIPIIRAYLIADTGNSYYFGNWGSAGFCFGLPTVSPKPSYVACATMTQVLDGMRFSRIVPTDSPTVYAMEFLPMEGNRDSKVVTCLWTLRGTRPVQATLARRQTVTLTDLMGNEATLPPLDGKVEFEMSESPIYLTSSAVLGELALVAPVHEGRPEGDSFVVAPLDSLDAWEVEAEPNAELEFYNFSRPRRKGSFAYATVAEFEGETNVLSVTPQLPADGSEYLPMYSVLKHKKGIEIPGEPTEVGLMVNGNGGWGRVIFEFEDAGGERWISIGAEARGAPTRWMADWLTEEQLKEAKGANVADWNTNDSRGRSYVNFEGWRYLRFPLPGNYAGVERYHWPHSSQWRNSDEGIVQYPLKLTKLAITIPEKALHLTEYRAVPRKEIYLKDLVVTYAPVAKIQ